MGVYLIQPVFADSRRPLRLPRRFVTLWSKSLKANSERDFKSSCPLQKHEPPQEPSAQHLEKAGRGQFPLLFRAGFRCRPLPNQTNHLAGTSPCRATGSRISSPLHGALIKTKPPCCRLRRFDRSYNASSLPHLNSNYATGAKVLYRHTVTGTSATAQSSSFPELLPTGPLSVWNFSNRWMSDCGVLIRTPT